jgi:hypothetical protein
LKRNTIMPAALPGSTNTTNTTGNPSAGRCVVLSSFSGPKGSPFDKDSTGKASTGQLSTGIGFGSPPIIGPTAPASIKAAGFNDNYTPGLTLPDGTNASDARLVAIGGGKSLPTGVSDPYVAGFALLMAGNGGSRDAGVGPAFTGFGSKMVTAVGTVAPAGVIETGFVNRSGVSLTVGQSTFGSDVAASAAPA